MITAAVTVASKSYNLAKSPKGMWFNEAIQEGFLSEQKWCFKSVFIKNLGLDVVNVYIITVNRM